MARNRQAVRIVRLLRLLESARHRPKVEYLAAVLRVDARTIYRDLAAVREGGWRLRPRRQQEAA